MGKLSADLDAFRKAQNLKNKLDDDSNNILSHLVGEISEMEIEIEYYRLQVESNEFADHNGDVLQAYK